MTEGAMVVGIHWITRAIEMTDTGIIVIGAGTCWYCIDSNLSQLFPRSRNQRPMAMAKAMWLKYRHLRCLSAQNVLE